MKARQYINMVGMAAAVLLSSCVKDTLYDTPHPNKEMLDFTNHMVWYIFNIFIMVHIRIIKWYR